MMTAIQMLQTVGIALVAGFARAALLLGVVMVLSVPFMLFAYTVRSAEGFWHRHHCLLHAHHHA